MYIVIAFTISLLTGAAPVAAQSEGQETAPGFDLLDANKDGVIDQAEFDVSARDMADAPGFSALDADGSETISPKEWTMWAEAGGETPTE